MTSFIESPIQDYVWCKIYIQFEPIFKTSVSLFKTFGMQKDDKITFCFGDVSAQGDVQKSVTKGCFFFFLDEWLGWGWGYPPWSTIFQSCRGVFLC